LLAALDGRSKHRLVLHGYKLTQKKLVLPDRIELSTSPLPRVGA
jgi:hypothetical protein